MDDITNIDPSRAHSNVSLPCKQYRFPKRIFPASRAIAVASPSASRLGTAETIGFFRDGLMIDRRFRHFGLGENATLRSHVVAAMTFNQLPFWVAHAHSSQSSRCSLHHHSTTVQHQRLHTYKLDMSCRPWVHQVPSNALKKVSPAKCFEALIRLRPALFESRPSMMHPMALDSMGCNS